MPKLSFEKRAELAYNELKQIGAPVYWGGWSNGAFRISGEENYDTVWADYYEGGELSCCDDFGVNNKINAVLNKYDLHAEWCNAGVLDVYDDIWG